MPINKLQQTSAMLMNYTTDRTKQNGNTCALSINVLQTLVTSESAVQETESIKVTTSKKIVTTEKPITSAIIAWMKPNRLYNRQRRPQRG